LRQPTSARGGIVSGEKYANREAMPKTTNDHANSGYPIGVAETKLPSAISRK